MPDRNWTESQLHAIKAEGGGVLVSAAAGSGKTAVLVERVIRLLTREKRPVPADRLLVVTFTKAAAAEMKQRISAVLSERIAEEPENQLLLEQQLLLSHSHICTIHAFCGELLRDNFELLDISPDYRIADETEIALLKQQAVEQVLEEGYKSETKDFIHLAEFFSSKDDRLLSDQILTIYDFIRSHPFPLKWLDEQEESYRHAVSTKKFPWIETVSEEIKDALAVCRALFEHAFNEIKGDSMLEECYLPAFENDYNFLCSLQNELELNCWDAAVSLASEHSFSSLRPLRKYDDQNKKDELGEVRNVIKGQLEEIKQLLLRCSVDKEIEKDLDRILPIMHALFNAVRKFYELLEEEKHQKNLLDFSDLELLSLKILAVPAGEKMIKTKLAKEYETRFDEILVDEYQDINEVQDAIFRALSHNEENLFLVGDIKQSIYRFRNAMPELFLRRSKRVFPYDGLHYPSGIHLDANFRSRKEVTNAVNYLFSCLMSPGLGDVDYTQESLKPMAKFSENSGYEAELQVIDYAGIQDVEEERVVYEARHIANEIKRMIAQEIQINDRGRLRQCRFGDFCILLRSMKDRAPLFENEFRRQGIPLWNDASLSYLDSEEVSTILNLLKVLDNPLQDIPLLAVMMSPLCRFTPDEAAEIRTSHNKEPLYFALKAYAENGDEKSRAFLKELERLRNLSVISRLDELLQFIYDTTGFMAFVSASQTGEQRAANLRLLLEYACHYEDAGYRGISGFIRYVDRMVERGQDFVAANVVNEKADVVRLMSIHRSKGLEFPICFVADLNKQFNTLDLRGEILLHPTQGIGFKIREPETLKHYATLPYEALRCSISHDMLAEELRVLYVALTRPREKLILVLSSMNFSAEVKKIARKSGGAFPPFPFALRKMKSFGEWILAAMLGSTELHEILNINFSDFPLKKSGIRLSFYSPVAEKDVEEFQVEDFSKVDDVFLKHLQEQVEFHYPYEKISNLPGKMTVTQVTKKMVEGDIVLAKPAFLREKRFSAAEKGTILHRFMQHINLEAAECLEDEIARQIEAAFLTQEQAEILDIQKIKDFLCSEIAEKMRNAGSALYREYKFMYEINASELYDVPGADQETVLIQGVADAVIVEEDGLIIVDYKTDRVDKPEQLDERYRAQLNLYGRALSKSFGRPVRQSIIYSFSLSKELELTDIDS